MSAAEKGGQAFPVPNGMYQGFGGMTLRDYFAAQAMPTVIAIVQSAFPDSSEFEAAVSEGCYAIADAMIEARKS